MTIFSATAHTNIALIKYWGKSALEGNLPATGSLSLTLDQFYTETNVRLIEGSEDVFVLSGEPADNQAQARVFAFVDLFRKVTGRKEHVWVSSRNFVPTSAGLASSASGFAALTLALTKVFELECDTPELTRLARRGSGSAARSLFGGFARMHGGPNIDDHQAFAEAIETPKAFDVRMIVLECARGPKAIGSREAMRLCKETSVLYQAFLDNHPSLLDAALIAAKSGQIDELGHLMEQSTLQMHATMLGCTEPFWYFNMATIAVIDEVRRLRKSGVSCYFTMDAGPHVKVLCKAIDADRIKQSLAPIFGVSKITVCAQGPAAYVHG